MPNTDINDIILVQRAIFTPSTENARAQKRGNRWNEQIVESKVQTLHGLADEGTYFTGTNPTPGTKIDYGSAGTQATFSDTTPFFLLYNKGTPGDPKARRSFLHFLKVLQIGGTAPATSTSVQAAVITDSKDRTPTSAASTFQEIVLKGANQDSAEAPQTQLWIPNGAVATIPASGNSSRKLARAQLKGGPTLVLDEYEMVFGSNDTPAGGGYLTTVASYKTRCGPVSFGPGQWCVVHLWLPGAATNAFSFEFELGLFER